MTWSKQVFPSVGWIVVVRLYSTRAWPAGCPFAKNMSEPASSLTGQVFFGALVSTLLTVSPIGEPGSCKPPNVVLTCPIE